MRPQARSPRAETKRLGQRVPPKRNVPVHAVLWLAALAVATTATGETDFTPQPQSSLAPVLHITWSRGPDLPQGFQDSSGGVVGGYLLTVCGFCAGHNNDQKPGMYPRGFMTKGWALNLAEPGSQWIALPDFPGTARQGMVGAVVENALYVWGGFNYTAPFCYRDGYRLTHAKGAWNWEPLPELPAPLAGSTACTVGSRIYLFGGADYDEKAFFTAADRNGGNNRLGARLFCIDTQHLEAGWRGLPECPGTPRWVCAFTALKERLYVMGGATGDPYATVVDNWAYDVASETWNRLRDLPVASGNFPYGHITFEDRYLLLCGGYQYARVANPDGTTRAPYGKPTRFHDKGDYYCDMFVYDTETGLFGLADNMPLNNNLSLTVLEGERLYLIGGETGGATVEGVFYGHHPELCLIGTLSRVR